MRRTWTRRRMPHLRRDCGMTIKRMVCFECGMKIRATIRQAKAHGWALWVGGALCKACSEKERMICPPSS